MGTAMELSCTEFVEVLASKAPAPGGGGAAAYVGALGCALGNMVGALTVGKAKYADVQDDIAQLNEQAAALEQELVALVARDAEVFEPLAAAYGMPKETEEQQAEKAQVMAKCLKDCCEVPLAIMAACGKAIKLCKHYADKGSRIALSDAGCGAIIAKSALQAASLNVFINTKSMADRQMAASFEAQADAMLTEYCALADTVFNNVNAELRG